MDKLMVISFLVFSVVLTAQTDSPDFYLGISYGRAFTLGDFGDDDITNPDSGFAADGSKLDLFGGFFLNEKVTVTGTFRYQTFTTEIENLIEDISTDNPDLNFSGNTEDWNVYYLFLGITYKIKVYKRFSLYPRFGIGPMWVDTPGFSIRSLDNELTQNLSRSSASGLGFAYELGIGLVTNLGKHLSLMPTFTLSSGIATIQDVENTTDNVVVTSSFDAKVQSFNLGLSLAYRFY